MTEKNNPENLQISQSDPDEINLLEYIYVLVKNKWWIIGATFLGLVLGYFLAIVKGPVYVTETVIAAKENDKQSGTNLSGLGSFGGLVASQLNLNTNPGLDKIDLILSSRKFPAELIEKYGLFNDVMKYLMPKIYKKSFDTINNEWEKDFIKPSLLFLGAGINAKFLQKNLNIKSNTITIKVTSKDSTFCDTLISKYLQYLNIYIQASVKTDARENVSYLENKLIIVSDPLLREKLQGMIANEIEKEMLVSKEAFKVIDPPLRKAQFKEKKLYPIAFSGVFFIFSLGAIVLLHALMSGKKMPSDKLYLELIKQHLYITKNKVST